MADEAIRKTDRLLSFSSSWDNEPQMRQKARMGMESISKEPLFVTDIAQSRFFTISLTGFQNFKVPGSSYNNFLPVKNVDVTYTNYNNLSIPVSIFGDFPLLNRKSVSTIRITCYDGGFGENLDIIEKALLKWEDECFPENKYVAYLDKIIRNLYYTSYGVNGTMSMRQVVKVIPTGSSSVSRSYEDNGAKLLSFSVIAVGYSGNSGKVGLSTAASIARIDDKIIMPY